MSQSPKTAKPLAADIVIEPATLADLDAMAAIAGTSFDDDTHTLLKAEFKGRDDHANGMRGAFESWLAHPKVDMLVAREASSGRVIGSVAWSRRGYAGDTDAPLGEQPPLPEHKAGPKTIADLAVFSDQGMEHWAHKLLPAGQRRRSIINLTVDPAFQGRGVGARLVRWGTDKADAEGVVCWVSSSMGALKAYERFGFRVVGKVEANLDEYAEGKRRKAADGSEGDWGNYIWWYMEREPKKV